MKKQFLECGKIVSMHGIKGEVKMYPWSSTPDLVEDFRTLYLDHGKTPITLLDAKLHKNMMILKIEGVDTIEQAVLYRGKTVYLNRDDVDMDKDDFFVQDLIGLTILDIDTGVCYGKICEVSETGANDVYHIKDEQGKIRLIPAIKQVVIETDIDGEVMKIRPLEGLFDED